MVVKDSQEVSYDLFGDGFVRGPRQLREYARSGTYRPEVNIVHSNGGSADD